MQVMDLRSSRAFGADQPGILEDGEVLGNRLPRRRDTVPHRQTAAQLEEALPVAHRELIEDEPPGRVGESPIDVAHRASIGKLPLAYLDPREPASFSRRDIRRSRLLSPGAGHLPWMNRPGRTP